LLKPFRALRPPPQLAANIACLPYDVVNRQEALAYAAGNAHCFFHVSRPEIDLPPDCDEHDDAVYARGRENLSMFRGNGWLRRDPVPAFYLYRQSLGSHTQVGVAGLARIADYDSERIRKHEHTRPDKEDDRTKHIYALGANDESVFLTYRAEAGIDALVDAATAASPEIDFVADDGVRHTIWLASAQTSAEFEARFAQLPMLYIADGHHRCAAASRAAKWYQRDGRGHGGHDYFLATLFPHNQVQILDYNRVVKDLNGQSAAQFLERLARDFDVAPSQQKQPTRPQQFGLYLDSQWYRLDARAGSFASDTLGALDVTILHENILRAVLGIDDVRTDARVQFIGGVRGVAELERLVDAGQFRAAFALFPTHLEQLMAVADAGGIMPPKSTWFEPKLRSGLLLHAFGD
jgi:uncharacterized protein (DUF1015 family)